MTVRNALPTVAAQIADQRGDRAVELFALVWRDPFVANTPYFQDLWGRDFERVVAAMPAERVAAAEERGRSLDLYETARQILAELQDLMPGE